MVLFGIVFFDPRALIPAPIKIATTKVRTIVSVKNSVLFIFSCYACNRVVTDGKRGVRDLFRFLPYQFCQFHQVAIVGRLLTKKPKLIASIEFKLIMNKLTNSTQLDFEQEITNWYTKWETFLGERTYSNDGKHYTRTHKNIWSAYRSVKFNLPYLFTYQKYPSLKIPNTSNALDGYFSHLKDKLRNHRGLRNTMRMKIVNELISY